MQNANPEPVIRAEGVGKEFGGVWVLHDITFDLRAGEVHALVGENGAGKSTFVKIISGVHRPSEGQLFIEGRRVDLRSARQSEELGIRTVHQEINQVPFFSVAENVFLGSEPTAGFPGLGLIDRRRMRERVAAVLGELGVELDVRRPAHTLDASHQRIVEICKVLIGKPKVIICDEPTTSLAEVERERLLRIIADLKRSHGIIYVSHNLEEVFRLSDRITVFRDGARIATVETKQTTEPEIISLMIGRKQYLSYRAAQPPQAESGTLLELRGVTNAKLRGVSLALRKGEVVGVAGVVGAGKTELARAIFGIDRAAGEFVLKGEKIAPFPVLSVRRGLALIPEDRQEQGLVLRMCVGHNVTLSYLDRWASRSVLNRQAERRVAERYIENLRIKTTGWRQVTRFLSGGNQQKVVLARWLAGDFEVGLFDEATKGIDVKAKQDIYQLIGELAARGKGILFFSSYLPELMNVAHRILVLRDGRLIGEFSPNEQGADERIMSAMLGGGTN
jgi:ribose transport system ATP-binding protein